MDTSILTNHQVELTARATSVHRAAIRRKLSRLLPGTDAYKATVTELEEITELSALYGQLDLERAS